MKIWKEVDTLLSSQISDEIQKTPDFKRAGVAKNLKIKLAKALVTA